MERWPVEDACFETAQNSDPLILVETDLFLATFWCFHDFPCMSNHLKILPCSSGLWKAGKAQDSWSPRIDGRPSVAENIYQWQKNLGFLGISLINWHPGDNHANPRCPHVSSVLKRLLMLIPPATPWQTRQPERRYRIADGFTFRPRARGERITIGWIILKILNMAFWKRGIYGNMSLNQ